MTPPRLTTETARSLARCFFAGLNNGLRYMHLPTFAPGDSLRQRIATATAAVSASANDAGQAAFEAFGAGDWEDQSPYEKYCWDGAALGIRSILTGDGNEIAAEREAIAANRFAANDPEVEEVMRDAEQRQDSPLSFAEACAVVNEDRGHALNAAIAGAEAESTQEERRAAQAEMRAQDN